MSKITVKQHLWDHVLFIRDVVFSLKPRAYLVATPTHPNLGDQAQLMCSEKWIKENYPGHKLVRIPVSLIAAHVLQFSGYLRSAIRCVLAIMLMRLFSRKQDIIFGHSGYFFIDHHSGWFSFARLAVAMPRTPLVILPQTINFMTPFIRNAAAKVFDEHPDTTILCRDETSLEKARGMFKKCRLLLYPDIVTTLIGSDFVKRKKVGRKGILFCMRDDLEMHYPREELEKLAKELGHERSEFSDTTIDADAWIIRDEKERLIREYIEYVQSFEVVVTDRYHGTIFSLIAETPVVVIDSSDHKLRSGVKWYPEETFGKHICFVESLEMTRQIVFGILNRSQPLPALPPLFKEQYYDRLKERLSSAGTRA
jgi:exopolysaccharide biosynthesis predicted pyruvyltransferase EpsI